jgi:hypothetical protein
VTKLALLATVIAGCASAHELSDGGNNIQLDGSMFVDAAAHKDGGHDVDAHAIDAHVIDAHLIDADEHRDAPPDACVPSTVDLLLNPAFDLTPVGTDWTQVPIDPDAPDISNQGPVQSNPYAVWLGGINPEGSALTDQVYQDVAIPTGTTQVVLTGYYATYSNEETASVVDTGSVDLVQTNGTPIENALSLSNLTNTGSDWETFSHTFTSNVAGQTVRVRMTSTLHGDGTGEDWSSFFFDTFALNVTYCP